MRFLFLCLLLLLTACGQSGKLYLPDSDNATTAPQNLPDRPMQDAHDSRN